MKHIYYMEQCTQPDGYRLVHTGLCESLVGQIRKQYLGVFDDCLTAVREARNIYPQVKGCVLCCRIDSD